MEEEEDVLNFVEHAYSAPLTRSRGPLWKNAHSTPFRIDCMRSIDEIERWANVFGSAQGLRQTAAAARESDELAEATKEAARLRRSL
eukprot:3072015-Pyramimonas_sp.AAC.1